MLYLKNKNCYLSGAIEYSTGPNWRIYPKETLTNIFKINVFDPFDDPKQQCVPELNEARLKNDFDTLTKIAKSFVRKDLSKIDRTDMVIAYLPYKVPTTGTHHEIINSNNAKKPTLLVCPEGKSSIPLWYYGFISHEFMFGSWEDLWQYLKEVDEGMHKDNDRWAYVYGLV